MPVQELTRVLISITLMAMMAAIGLDVTLANLSVFVRDAKLIARAILANYVVVPAVTVGLLWGFRSGPDVAAGFLILAACPGAPFGPPLVAIAKGNVPSAAGLMALLAASSTLMAPLLLAALLPLFAEQQAELQVTRMMGILLLTQFFPFCAGLVVRHLFPYWAQVARKPTRLLGAVLSLAAITMVLATNFKLLAEIKPVAYCGMAALLLASFAIGWCLGGLDISARKTMALTTSLRNVGLALMIASTTFAGTAAVNAVAAFGLIEVFGALAAAFLLGRYGPSRPADVAVVAPSKIVASLVVALATVVVST